jgi:hypothetical protein
METKFFTPLIDQPGADILKILINSGPGKLTGDQRHVWTKYVMALHTRRPETIQLAREVGRQSLINTLGNDPEYAQMKTDGMPDSLLDFVAPWIIENFGMLNAPAIVDHEPTHNIIMGMRWWCVNFSLAKYDLLTGDRPLIWPMGANRPEFYFALPLSPRLCFFATKTASIEKMFRDSYRSRLARQVNEAVVSQASEYVYAAHGAHSKFVERRLKQNAVA